MITVAISLILHQQAAASSIDESQSQDLGSNTTTDYEQSIGTATQAAADTSQLVIDSREQKQDATTPSQLQQYSTVVRQSSSPYTIQEQQQQQPSSRGPLQRKLSSRPNLASRLRSNGGSNYQLANYSQPFDARPASVYYRNHLMSEGETRQPLAATGRALNSAAPSAAVADSPSAAALYAYHSAPSQRAQQSAAVAAAAAATTNSAMAAANENGVGPSSLMLEEPISYGQENMLDYTPPLQHAHTVISPSRVPYYPNAAAGLRHPSASSGGGESLAHFLASPSINSVGYDDYYNPLGSSSDYGSANGDNYNLARTPFSYYGNNGTGNLYESFGYPHYASSSSSSSSPLDSYQNYHLPTRSRWSWPWTDVSSYSNRDHHHPYSLHQSPVTSATFKKHYHHHHLPTKHKEHDHHHHHEEYDSLMPKWEHGISIGEMACIAVAVVLGIIILGSPFFLLFLMLFNGGNLFGTTQMGLLAPATVQGGTAGVAGRRRRRKRSLDDTFGAAAAAGFNPQVIEAKYKEHGVYGVTEYLFQKLSPLMDSAKLLQSFERMMDVKDDIEKIVTKLAKQDESKGEPAVGWTSGLKQHQHTEMKRKRR